MADIRTTDTELAMIVFAERGYVRSNVDDWVKHCTSELTTVDDVIQFVHSLPECCHKRKYAIRNLTPFWTNDFSRAIIVLGKARNVCCGCHLTGSFTEI